MIKESINQSFTVAYRYQVHFTKALFSIANPVLARFFASHATDIMAKALVVVDDGVVEHHVNLLQEIRAYFESLQGIVLADELMVVNGGEQAKNDHTLVDRIIDAVDRHGIDRHSYVIGIGGGAVLDAVGYAAAISHRGIRHIRIPTTVLSQNDSGIGVKNGINYLGKKNFIGTFSPPFAVFNDFSFLQSLSDRAWRSGISEAVKVALIKDAVFFEWIAEHAGALTNRDADAMEYLVYRCAELHLQHIAGADPFEFGSSRPLDFGHWSAHKLEQLSGFEVMHGEAVAIGIALDSSYSYLMGYLTHADAQRIVQLLQALGLPVFHPLLDAEGTDHPLLIGLDEFREHLGGRLTIMLLQGIGKGMEVHTMDASRVLAAASMLQNDFEVQL
ncbi:3-dehydroquinate synthase [Parapedobacter koreensis]|uniref:3-dehydroquinate synthase n=1 Tax=Parapedobacter koreensis TaxID=332977 RepID=A0A1H7EYN9_9SPHI|nr:3-dehydroquinate synthase [Parapedobacter koreensis]SEK18898.1 3-dehydroquinate synthase [Parapedobacter koreensis]